MNADILPRNTADPALLWAEIERLRAELARAHNDPIWGVLTRVGLERRMQHADTTKGVLVLDLDDLHGANDRYGHAGLDARMTRALGCLRKTDVGRWQNGDELVVIAPVADLKGIDSKLARALRREGLSATRAWAASCTREAIVLCQARIEAAKRAGERGRCFVVEGGEA